MGAPAHATTDEIPARDAAARAGAVLKGLPHQVGRFSTVESIAQTSQKASPGASANFTVPFSLTLRPGSSGAGTTITVSGTGFWANEGVTVFWDQTDNQVATATANGSGAFSTSFAAPSGTGNHVVLAAGQSSHFTLATAFTLSGTGNVGGASLSRSPASGPDGSQVNLTGTGFGGGEQVNLDSRWQSLDQLF